MIIKRREIFQRTYIPSRLDINALIEQKTSLGVSDLSLHGKFFNHRIGEIFGIHAVRIDQCSFQTIF